MLRNDPSCNFYFLCPLPAHCVGSLCGLRLFHRPPPRSTVWTGDGGDAAGQLSRPRAPDRLRPGYVIVT